MDKRKWFSRIESSQRDLRDAKRWLETEEAITWVCDKIRTSVLWAMEAWFLQRGIEPDFGNGWLSMQLQFFEIAPKALSQKGMWALSEATFLEYKLEEDS